MKEFISTQRLKVGGAPITPKQQIPQKAIVTPKEPLTLLFKSILRVFDFL